MRLFVGDHDQAVALLAAVNHLNRIPKLSAVVALGSVNGIVQSEATPCRHLNQISEKLYTATFSAISRSSTAGGPRVKPGFAASDAAVLFDYTTHPSGTRAGNPTQISGLNQQG